LKNPRVSAFICGQKNMYSPYDFNQSIAHRAEYVEERLKAGMPVIGISYDEGILLFTVKRTQRKVFEIYDQIIYSAIGNQADVEAVRLASIDFAHQEGFSRSPDDVSIQRLVGFAISPPLKRAFGDPMTTPNVLRALFAEIGSTPDKDQFFVLNYDGEFSNHSGFAIATGAESAEDAMREKLAAHEGVPDLKTAIERAREAFRVGIGTKSDDEDGGEPGDALEEALKVGEIEAAVLERNTPRESKFRLLTANELV
jgi:proteasome alpha subunit